MVRCRVFKYGCSIPCCGIGFLDPPESVENFLAMRSWCALQSRFATGSHHVHVGKRSPKLPKELSQIQIGEPGVDNDRLRQSFHRFPPCLCATLCLANLPP